uniref:DHC_N1 domain-containing protein n=1 Tax=Bursaphelenchus xylophilus TaxID=6326 RepID=A0A1I7SP32_BURXY
MTHTVLPLLTEAKKDGSNMLELEIERAYYYMEKKVGVLARFSDFLNILGKCSKCDAQILMKLGTNLEQFFLRYMRES